MEQCIVIEVEGDHDIHNNDDTHSGFGLPWDQCFSVPLLQLLPNPSLKRHILQLSAGTNHLAFVCNEGHLFTWGEGKDGQLGLGKDILQTCVPIRVDTKGKHIVKVSCGYVHTACLYIGTDVTAHPQLLGCLTFGAGLCGALGTGSDTVSCNVPRSVLVPAQVRHLLHDPSDEEQEQEHSFFNTAATPSSRGAFLRNPSKAMRLMEEVGKQRKSMRSTQFYQRSLGQQRKPIETSWFGKSFLSTVVRKTQ